jgi:hypothetical protein
MMQDQMLFKYKHQITGVTSLWLVNSRWIYGHHGHHGININVMHTMDIMDIMESTAM